MPPKRGKTGENKPEIKNDTEPKAQNVLPPAMVTQDGVVYQPTDNGDMVISYISKHGGSFITMP